jgi:hypothetical protein
MQCAVRHVSGVRCMLTAGHKGDHVVHVRWSSRGRLTDVLGPRANPEHVQLNSDSKKA